MLVIAGPGSGKTHTIQLRAVNLLLSGRTLPCELALCTFGRDAARQLQRRFESSALACGFTGEIKEFRSPPSTACAAGCWIPAPPWSACDGTTGS